MPAGTACALKGNVGSARSRMTVRVFGCAPGAQNVRVNITRNGGRTGKESEGKEMTKGDRIRQMTDEELAVWLASRMLCGDCPLYEKDKERKCWSLDCVKAALEYLHQDAEEDYL